jgi:hypothetical protein
VNKNQKSKRDETPKRLPEKKATQLNIPKEVKKKQIKPKGNPLVKNKV